MHDVATLAFLPDLFEVGAPAFAVRRPDGTGARLNAAEVSGLQGPVISFETNVLVDQLRAVGCLPPAGLIEIGDAMKLRAGRSKADGGVKAWDFWRELHRSGGASGETPFTRELFFAKVERPGDADVDASLKSATNLVFKMWEGSIGELAARDESGRFSAIETKVQKIFFERQAKGILLDKQRVRSFIEVAKAEKYAAYVNVAETLKVSPTGLSFRNIGQYLDRTDAAHLAPFCDGPNAEEHFKIAAERSKFATEFLAYMRASRDVNTLSRLMNPEVRVHPHFHVMGTVTGRVLVSEPHLQQLRRRFRGVLSADPGFCLVYLDYRQFEPGIMADLSGDAAFIEAYNSTDLYRALSVAVFDTDEHRALCKRVFLAFCYGMTRTGLATLLLGNSPSQRERESVEGRLEKFFSSYPGLEKLKAKLEAELLDHGFIASVMGNRRYRLSQGRLSAEERRWSLSQRIQGTAALIFKEALVRIAEELSPDMILLPMHDAVLLQLPEGHAQELKARATELMSTAFSQRCPAITPKISDEAFAL